ncbi:MAG: hypothetical protein JWM40_1279 [Frankiales bacterium]|nr:hypothetical protein [Frankiales bacterium]
MTVSAGVGGGSVVGVVLGGGAVTGSGMGAPAGAADVVSTLPFTGATHLELLIALAMVLLVVGSLTVGLVRRSSLGSEPSAG